MNSERLKQQQQSLVKPVEVLIFALDRSDDAMIEKRPSQTCIGNFGEKMFKEMRMNMKIILCLLLNCAIAASGQLAVTVSTPKLAGQKAVVELKMKNEFAEGVKSARAICFLLDDQGKMVGESAKWIIGGTKNRPPLEPKQETSFNFIITSAKPFTTTNLSAKVSFSRLILESGASISPKDNVTIGQELPLTNQVSVTNNPVISKPLEDVIASASEHIPIKLPSRTSSSETIMVTNSLQPLNPQQH